LSEAWSGELQNKVMTLVQKQTLSKHPQTVAVNWGAPGVEKKYYLKVFHKSGSGGVFKDFARVSKAFRFWRQGLALSAAGFNVPLTIAAGELRCWRCFKRAFVLTAQVDGQPLPMFLADLAAFHDRRKALKLKRAGVARLADLIRQFHGEGFVHGDMIASNLLVSETGGDEPKVYFMDNDRTRRYSLWFPQSLWKRNLIQLNRMPLPGITLQDRMRFYHIYFRDRSAMRKELSLLRWFEKKTRKRRKECDAVDASGNYRKLMAWRNNLTMVHNAE
jgi:hypothetical protein